MNGHQDIIQAVYQVILDRKANPGENSYTSTLMHKGIDSILKKVGEEATEVVIAAKGGRRDEIVCETVDLIYHLLVMLGYHDIPPSEVYDELRRRFGISGLAEKASRLRILNPDS
jgi:phosphoribosyl-ATP pyrophosphohydrolase